MKEDWGRRGTPRRSATFLGFSAVRVMSGSASTTHGPAMRNRSGAPQSIPAMDTWLALTGCHVLPGAPADRTRGQPAWLPEVDVEDLLVVAAGEVVPVEGPACRRGPGRHPGPPTGARDEAVHAGHELPGGGGEE